MSFIKIQEGTSPKKQLFSFRIRCVKNIKEKHKFKKTYSVCAI